MKKFFASILFVAFLFSLAVPTSAAHTHGWDFTIDDEKVNIYCYCGSKLIIPTDEEANSCEHDFTDFYTAEGHGKECENCGFLKFDAHDFRHSFADDEHYMYCRNCDYEEFHETVSYHDDYLHYIECDECEAIFEHTMSAYDVGEHYHYYECDNCDYYIREAHTYNEEGFCIECQLFTGFITDIIPLDSGYDVEVLINDTHFFYETYCDMEEYELNSLVDFMVYDGEIIEISTVLSSSDLEDHDYLEKNFEIGKVSQDFMYEFENKESFDDSDVFLFSIKHGSYRVKSTNELILYTPSNPHLYPIIVPID